MKASIIISVRNDARIDACLASIFNGGLDGVPKCEVEVIVVENSAVPVLEATIRKYPVLYAIEPRVGMGWARLRALSLANGDFVVFTDADCVVSTGWLTRLLAPFQDPQVGIVGGPIVKFRPRGYAERLQRGLVVGDQKTVQYLAPLYGRPYVVTANAAFRGSALRSAGGIDPAFSSCGDVDMAWRIGDAGFAATIAPEAVVSHCARPTVWRVFWQFSTYSKGHARLFAKYRGGRRLCWNSYLVTRYLTGWREILNGLLHHSDARSRRAAIGAGAFGVVESLGLMHGAVVGSLKERVIYF